MKPILPLFLALCITLHNPHPTATVEPCSGRDTDRNFKSVDTKLHGHACLKTMADGLVDKQMPRTYKPYARTRKTIWDCIKVTFMPLKNADPTAEKPLLHISILRKDSWGCRNHGHLLGIMMVMRGSGLKKNDRPNAIGNIVLGTSPHFGDPFFNQTTSCYKQSPCCSNLEIDEDKQYHQYDWKIVPRGNPMVDEKGLCTLSPNSNLNVVAPKMIMWRSDPMVIIFPEPYRGNPMRPPTVKKDNWNVIAFAQWHYEVPAKVNYTDALLLSLLAVMRFQDFQFGDPQPEWKCDNSQGWPRGLAFDMSKMGFAKFRTAKVGLGECDRFFDIDLFTDEEGKSTKPPAPPTPPPPTTPRSTTTESPVPTLDPTSKTTPSVETTTKSSSKSNIPDIYRNCGETKNCLALPKTEESLHYGDNKEAGCIEKKACDMVLAYGGYPDDEIKDNEIVIEIYHQERSGWLALGISESDTRGEVKMDNTYVIECVDDGGSIRLHNSYNIPSNTNKRLTEQKPVRLMKAALIKPGLGIYCKFAVKGTFTIKIPVIGGQITYNIKEKPYHVMYAIGSEEQPHGRKDSEIGNLAEHKRIPKPYKFKVALGKRVSPNPKEKEWIKYHAQLATAAIIFFMTMGIFVAKYFKETLPARKLWGKPWWYILHVFCMSSAVLIFTASVIFQIKGKLGWVAIELPDNKYASHQGFHTFGGCIGYALLGINFGIGFFVSVSHYGHWNVLSIVHSLIGHLTYFLGAALIIFSYGVTFAEMPCTLRWIVGLWTFTYFVKHCIYSYHYVWVDWVLGLPRGRSFRLSPIGLVFEDIDAAAVHQRRPSRPTVRDRGINIKKVAHPLDEPIEVPGWKIRLLLLFFSLLFSFCYMLWAVSVMENPRRICGRDFITVEQFSG